MEKFLFEKYSLLSHTWGFALFFTKSFKRLLSFWMKFSIDTSFEKYFNWKNREVGINNYEIAKKIKTWSKNRDNK